MSSCGQELCGNWTGQGCACEVMGLDPVCGPCESGTHRSCDDGDSDVCCCDARVWCS